MKGSSLKNFIVIVAAISMILLTYVVVRSEIKRFTREKILKLDMVNERLNRIESKLVEIQKLTSEDRVVKIAGDSLGLVRPKEKLEIISISRDQVSQMEKLLNSKYE